MKKETTATKMIEHTFIAKTEYFCDLCKEELKRVDTYDVKSNKIVFKQGKNYGADGGNTDYEEAYFCDGCKEKIKAQLIKMGVAFTVRETDW